MGHQGNDSELHFEAAHAQLAQVPRQPEVVPSTRPAPQAEALPQPAPAPATDPLGPDRFRLPLLSDTNNPLGTTPQPSPEVDQAYGQFLERTIDPESTLTLVQSRPRLLVFREPPLRLQMADDSVADFQLITDREISVEGRKVGSTILNLWFRDPTAPGQTRVLSYLVQVIPDPEERLRLERVYKALEAEINQSFPNSWVQLSLVGDKLVVRGEAKDIVEAAQVLQICRANAPGNPEQIPVNSVDVVVGANLPTTQTPLLGAGAISTGGVGGPVGALPVQVPGVVGEQPLPGLGDFLLRGSSNVINLLRVPGEQQVMLRVTVAEVNRSASRSLGIDFTIANSDGLNVFSQLTGAIGTGNLPTLLDNGQIRLAIRALRNLNLARSLAEPNLVTLNGQQASFQAGGQFPVPTGVASFGAAAQGVAFVPFGVTLAFVPYITDKDRVRLQVSAQVSTRDEALGTNIGGSAAAGGTNVAGLNSRTFFTTVELREGQTLSVAGLIQSNFGSTSQRVPLWGDLPLIGMTGGRNDTTSDEQELVILVTPELVAPLEACNTPQLPGCDIFEPGDIEFFLLNRLESRRSYDYRAPTRTDFARQVRYIKCEDQLLIGSQGYSFNCCPGRCGLPAAVGVPLPPVVPGPEGNP